MSQTSIIYEADAEIDLQKIYAFLLTYKSASDTILEHQTIIEELNSLAANTLLQGSNVPGLPNYCRLWYLRKR